MKELIVPPFTVRYFDYGAHCTDIQDGDILAIEHTTIFAGVIRFGQRLNSIFHKDLRPFVWCNHWAIVRHGDDGHDISEMGPRGYERRDLINYAAKRYAVVRISATPEQVAVMMDDDIACENIAYGFVQYVPLAIDCLSGLAFFAGYGDTAFCSQDVTQKSIALGLWPNRSPAGTFPMHLAQWFGVRWPTR